MDRASARLGISPAGTPRATPVVVRTTALTPAIDRIVRGRAPTATRMSRSSRLSAAASASPMATTSNVTAERAAHDEPLQRGTGDAHTGFVVDVRDAGRGVVRERHGSVGAPERRVALVEQLVEGVGLLAGERGVAAQEAAGGDHVEPGGASRRRGHHDRVRADRRVGVRRSPIVGPRRRQHPGGEAGTTRRAGTSARRSRSRHDLRGRRGPARTTSPATEDQRPRAFELGAVGRAELVEVHRGVVGDDDASARTERDRRAVGSWSTALFRPRPGDPTWPPAGGTSGRTGRSP